MIVLSRLGRGGGQGGHHAEILGQKADIVTPGKAGGPQAVEEEKGRAVTPLFKVPTSGGGNLGHIRDQG